MKSMKDNYLAVVLETNREYSEKEIAMYVKKLENNKEISEYKKVKKYIWFPAIKEKVNSSICLR